MKNIPNKNFRRNDRGFTLIEVVLSVAVASVGVIAILGLLPSAVQSARSATDNTLSATIVQDTFNSLRSGPFTAAPVCVVCGAPTVNLQNSTPPSAKVYFDYQGIETNMASAYYEMNLEFANPISPSLSLVTARVIWPAKALAPINTNVFVTQVAKYDLR